MRASMVLGLAGLLVLSGLAVPAAAQPPGDGGVDSIDASGTGRYVRIHGTARGTGWGYSLYEFGLYAPD